MCKESLVELNLDALVIKAVHVKKVNLGSVGANALGKVEFLRGEGL
jgi:hypothetical protein